MAKKAKTPPPPRRVQAPKQRTGGGDDLGARQRTILYAVAGSGIVALLAVVLFVVLAGGGGGSAKAAVKAIQNQGCRYRRYPEQPRAPHYTTLKPPTPPRWNSFPPTSGRHYYQPVPLNQYSEAVPEIQLVHNLEHGAVILQYGDAIPRAQVAEITDWYRQDPNGVVVAPLPKLGDKVALTAWTHWAECTGFDAKAANAFRKAFRYKAPEKFPKSALNPGS